MSPTAVASVALLAGPNSRPGSSNGGGLLGGGLGGGGVSRSSSTHACAGGFVGGSLSRPGSSSSQRGGGSGSSNSGSARGNHQPLVVPANAYPNYAQTRPFSPAPPAGSIPTIGLGSSSMGSSGSLLNGCGIGLNGCGSGRAGSGHNAASRPQLHAPSFSERDATAQSHKAAAEMISSRKIRSASRALSR